MDIRNKVTNFIKYCSCLSEFDKYFWLTNLKLIDKSKLVQMYEILLKNEHELIHLELKSIGQIKYLIDGTYPELADKYLPNYYSLYNDYKAISNELTIEEINKIREKLKKELIN